MSLKSKIEAVIYASEEPVPLAQLTSVLAGEAAAELDALAALQTQLNLGDNTGDVEFSGPQSTPVPPVQYHGGAEDGELQEDSEAQANAVSPKAEPLSSDPQTDQKNDPEHDPGQEPEDVQPLETASDAEFNAAESSDAGVGDTAENTASDRADGIQEVLQQDENQDVAQQDAEAEKRRTRDRERAIRDHIRRTVDELIRDYADSDRGIEVREVAGGFRMGTKPEYHDAVRGFVRSLKPALKLSLQALETLAVVAYKQPVTAAEISEIRGVDSAGVLGGLMTRKLIATAGRKQVIGRPMLYKTTKEFLVRFGLRDLHELPSMEEFERMAGELNEQEDLPMESAEAVIERTNLRGDAEHIRETNAEDTSAVQDTTSAEFLSDEPDNQTPEGSSRMEAPASGASHVEDVSEEPHPEPYSQPEGNSSAESEARPTPEETHA